MHKIPVSDAGLERTNADRKRALPGDLLRPQSACGILSLCLAGCLLTLKPEMEAINPLKYRPTSTRLPASNFRR
jgi:hypothetical protein